MRQTALDWDAPSGGIRWWNTEPSRVSLRSEACAISGAAGYLCAAQLDEPPSRVSVWDRAPKRDTYNDWLYYVAMTARRMGAAQFKERCLQVLDEVPAEGVIITKRGKPVARLTPFERSGESLIGALKGRATSWARETRSSESRSWCR
jgi:prevent-host-death family protein